MRTAQRSAVLLLLIPLLGQDVLAADKDALKESGAAVLWSDPGDIHSRDLFWGPGGKDHQPQTPVEFVKEDMHGTNPKFDVQDGAGKKWKAKLGLEAKPETAASRLLWAVGYLANEDYFFPELQVSNMPAFLHRWQELSMRSGKVSNVRLQRPPHGYKKNGDWNWRHNPFFGTREFNGLRIMMGLIGNWDLKDDNNAVLEKEKSPGPKFYEVTDVGTAFGTPGKSYTNQNSKKNLPAYQHNRLIARTHADSVDLNFPHRPPLLELAEFEWGFFFHQVRMRWIGKNIPRSDAKWIGSLLAQLSPNQIRDAFCAAGYSDMESEAYTQAVLSRIRELNSL
jgi:hypothetical protein